MIAPLALAGAYFAPVLFAAAGATTIAAIKTSLLTTGLGSLVGGLNNKGRFGINVVFPIDNGVDHNISNPNPKKAPTNSANLTQQETFNLEQFKARYTETVDKILTNKIEIEDTLRHPLLKSMSSTFSISAKRETIPAIAQRNRTLKKNNQSDLLVVKHYSDRTSSLLSSTNSYLDVGIGEKLLILSGGVFKNVARGIKQSSYMVRERLGMLEPGTTALYTDRMNSEMQLYNRHF